MDKPLALNMKTEVQFQPDSKRVNECTGINCLEKLGIMPECK